MAGAICSWSCSAIVGRWLDATPVLDCVSHAAGASDDLFTLLPTEAVPILPGPASAYPRMILAVETHENWLEAHRYLNMDDLKEHKKD